MNRMLKKLLACGSAAVLTAVSAVMPCFAAGADEDSGRSVAPVHGTRILVALGDSYSSGEGNAPFLADPPANKDDEIKEDWLTHRSADSWSSQLKLEGVSGTMGQHRNEYWYFVADSGAVTEDVTNNRWKDYSRTFGSLDNVVGSKKLDPQIQVFDQLGGKKAEYVTMTMGGNDMGFASVVSEAVGKSVVGDLRSAAINSMFMYGSSGSYVNVNGFRNKLDEIWDRFDNAYETEKDDGTKVTSPCVRYKLKETYKAIANKAGRQAKIIVAGYPMLMAENGVIFDAEIAALVRSRIVDFNNGIKQIIKECQSEGINIRFAPVAHKFEGHESNVLIGAYLNCIELPAKPDDIEYPGFFSAHSMHPNANGVKMYAEAVQHVLSRWDAGLTDDVDYDAVDRDFLTNGVSGGGGGGGGGGGWGDEDSASGFSGGGGSSRGGGASASFGDDGSGSGSGSYSGSDTGQYAPGFAIEGTWRVTSDYGFGQAQPGAYVQFDGEYCNLRTEDDCYELTMDNDRWYLDTLDPDDVYTAFLVDTFDDSHIRLTGVDEGGDLMMDYIVELERVSGSGGGSGSQYEDGSGGEFSGGSVPSGTYVMKAFGVVVASYTFYEGNRISMNTVGITGTGTYVLEDGYIIVTYTTSLDPNGKQYKWQTSFSMHGDTVVIGGDELVRQ